MTSDPVRRPDNDHLLRPVSRDTTAAFFDLWTGRFGTTSVVEIEAMLIVEFGAVGSFIAGAVKIPSASALKDGFVYPLGSRSG